MKIPQIVLRLLAEIKKGGAPLKGINIRNKEDSLMDLLDNHFEFLGNQAHPCRATLTHALKILNQNSAVIIETGSSAWGTNSSVLFDSYVNSFGGRFHSCDIRIQPAYALKKMCSKNSQFYCDDSVNFLREIAKSVHKVDMVYLDSWDVNWADPIPSAIHGLNEFFAIWPTLKKGGLLLVDDTPKSSAILMEISKEGAKDFDTFEGIFGFTPGKGGLIKKFLEANSLGKMVTHEYQLLWQF